MYFLCLEYLIILNLYFIIALPTFSIKFYGGVFCAYRFLEVQNISLAIILKVIIAYYSFSISEIGAIWEKNVLFSFGLQN